MCQEEASRPVGLDGVSVLRDLRRGIYASFQSHRAGYSAERSGWRSSHMMKRPANSSRCSAARLRGRLPPARSTGKLPTIGFLGAASPSTQSQWVAAFVQRLRELGWIEGRTVAIEFRWAEGRSERFAEIAAEFVRLKVDVIVTRDAQPRGKAGDIGHPDRVRGGGGPSARPGRESGATGRQRHRPVTPAPDLAGKRVELLREVVPGLRRLAIMVNIGNPAAVLEMGEVQATARTLASRSPHSKSGGRRISRRPSRR